ncbi:hypothetical protein ACV229_09875 [Burkholderia sp. MR1-5-21]
MATAPEPTAAELLPDATALVPTAVAESAVACAPVPVATGLASALGTSCAPTTALVPVDCEPELVDSEADAVEVELCAVLTLVEVDVESAVDVDVVVLFCVPFPNPGELICVDSEDSPVDSEVTAVLNVDTLPFVVLKPVERDATPVKS